MQPRLAAITPGAAKLKPARGMPGKCRATPEREARNRERRCRASRNSPLTSRVVYIAFNSLCWRWITKMAGVTAA
ncbi:hypothetical protein MTO96_025751 [Rhipicephalus appendiculatus]